MAIRYYEQEVRAKLSNKRKLSDYLLQLVNTHLPQVKHVDLRFIFCTDEYLLAINQQFLDHDTFTDIITFDLSEDKEILEGEIYISVQRIQDNAAKFHTDYRQELHRVIFHGVLHLCGFKDKTTKDKELMRLQENSCLEAYFNS
ncbi:MAG TPA: rRNA maturation RNase YbeY [Flavipsychrobacter sp.]|nr:rRNA maturation RNase YbeY [Flavipsychrobacter sp.]